MKKFLNTFIKRNFKYFLITFIFVALNMYIAILPPKIIGNIIDLLSNTEQNRNTILLYLLYLIGSVLLYLLTRLPWRSLVSFVSRALEKDLKDCLFKHFTQLSMTDLHSIKNGEFMSYFTKDVSEIRAFFYRFVAYGSRIIAISFIVTYTMITQINLKLTLLILLPILVTCFLVIKIKKYVELNFKKSQKHFTELSEYVQESTDSIRTIKAYSTEENRMNTFRKKNFVLKQSNNAVDIHSTLLSTCINIGFGLCYGIHLIFGSQLVLNNTISIGDFIAFQGYIGLFYGPISWMPSIISRFKRAQISSRRLNNFLSLKTEELPYDVSSFPTLSGDIEFSHLSYAYPSSVNVVLKDISFTIRKGETLGIIGTIGSGKTSLMNLLLKLYPVKDGQLFIDGKDINTIPLETIRNSFCYITQDNFLFSTTLKENIKLFKDYSDDAILKSSHQAMLKEDLQNMKNGIDTIVGERGVDLSGGQKQRVVLSRAFLQKSNFVIFDDTFSALDNKTEEAVLQNVKELTEGKTCIIISNRISDVKDADNILVLNDGEIIQSGTHETLCNQYGLYQKFYHQQSSKQEILD